MKIVNLFKKELKTKWSSRLLVVLIVLVVSSVFGSSFLLKREYDLVKDENASKGRFEGYKKLVNQPFRHIKTMGGIGGQISIESSEESVVFIREKEKNWARWSEYIFVRHDTLFVNFDKEATKDEYNYPFKNAHICILSPNIQSIEADNSYITVGNWQQKSLAVNLINESIFETARPIANLDFCKISMSNFSKFIITNHVEGYVNRRNGENIASSPTKILTVEANLKDSCILYLGNTTIQNFKLNATKGNKIELSSETMNALMKK